MRERKKPFHSLYKLLKIQIYWSRKYIIIIIKGYKSSYRVSECVSKWVEQTKMNEQMNQLLIILSS